MGSNEIAHSVTGQSAYEAEKARLASLETESTIDFTVEEPVVVHKLVSEDEPVIEDLVGESEALNPEAVRQFKELISFGSGEQQGLRADPVDLVEFQEFKRQVIAAFRHLGLDIRKHFTE